MARDYSLVETSAEVWAVIKARHSDKLRVFGSWSDPNGDLYSGGRQGAMFTSYGFEGAHWPIMEAETKWDIDPEHPHKRMNEKTQYWLCLPDKEGEA